MMREGVQLKNDRVELQQRLDELNAIRKDEKETALAVEMSLRDHCSRAHAAYSQMVQ